MANKIDNIVDSIQSPQTTKSAIPQEILHANVVIGYIAGNSWLTWPVYKGARTDLAAKGLVIPCSMTYAVPHGIKWCIYDIENGGGKNENIGLFAARCDRSVPFYLYTFASNGKEMLAAARSFGLVQGRDFFYIAAHVTGKPHICEPNTCNGYPRADITQYLFASAYDKSMGWDYALPNYHIPVKTDPYTLFPASVGDSRFPNHGSERLTVEQADGALQHPAKYRDYLKGTVRNNVKLYRDRCWRIAKFQEPDFKKPRNKALWNDGRHLGARWQALNIRMKKIDAIK